MLDGLLPQVKRNCLISDATHWGYYSICGLLMRLRGLYRFEHGLKPWDRADEADVLRWIGETEAMWAEAQEADLMPITVGADTYGPFDSEGINRVLAPHGLLYGAGYGIHMKPTFFLADLSNSETIEGFPVLTAGREYARDLSVHPAMLRGGVITARSEVAELLIWDKFDEFGHRKTAGVLDAAFSAYGIVKDAKPEEIAAVASSELRTYIYHEVGEAVEGERLGGRWPEMLGCAGGRKTAAFLRAVKDTLADTSPKGMLAHITEGGNAGSVAFYLAFLDGYRFYFARRIKAAFEQLRAEGDWKPLEAARLETYQEASDTAGRLVALYGDYGDTKAFSLKVEEYISGLDIGRKA